MRVYFLTGSMDTVQLQELKKATVLQINRSSLSFSACNKLTVLLDSSSREQQHLNTPLLQRTPVSERKGFSTLVTGPLPAKIQGHLRAGKPNVG